MEHWQEIEEEEEIRRLQEEAERHEILGPEDLREMYEEEPPKVTPEQQEIHKGPEDRLVETESGGPHRPLWDMPPPGVKGPYELTDVSGELPEQFEFGEQITEQMDTLWQKSVQDIDKGVVNEYGSTLVREQDGELKLVNPVKGTSNSVMLNLDIAEGEEFIGTFHTHPHRTAFSDQDFFSAFESQEKISLLCSGDETYALVGTDLTPEAVDANELREAFDQEMLRHMDDPNVSFSEAVYLTNIEMCRRYGLAFYKGKGGSLTEVYRP